QIAAVIVYVIARRFAGSPVRAQSFVLPAALAGYGLLQLRGAHVGLADIAFLAVEAVLPLAIGAAPGTPIKLYVRDGLLWQRYRWTTLVAWVGAIALRVGLTVLGHLTGVSVIASSLLFVMGLNLLAEAVVVGVRAQRHGAPIAPRRPVRV